jgi:isochorismate synthase
MPEKLIQYCLDHNIAFAFWRYPGGEIKGVFANHAVPLQAGKDPNGHGFMVAPFYAEDRLPTYFIRATKTYPEISQTDEIKTLSNHSTKDNAIPHITTKDEYIEAFSQLKIAIDNEVIEKVVLSRTRESNAINLKMAGKMFSQLEKTYPGAMAYIFNIPQRGCWMGVTPEILLSKQGRSYETVAVAGTRAANNREEWTNKEEHEQGVVSMFIERILHTNNIRHFNKKGPENFTAGNVVHLKTSYSISEDEISGKALAVARALHPTPAVCGIPRNKSRKLIKKAETHLRGFYSGFLGEVDFRKQDVKLYVNLRCMQVFKDRAVLYAGGGLTKGSEAEKEWEETQEKTRTLLNVAEKLK